MWNTSDWCMLSTQASTTLYCVHSDIISVYYLVNVHAQYIHTLINPRIMFIENKLAHTACGYSQSSIVCMLSIIHPCLSSLHCVRGRSTLHMVMRVVVLRSVCMLSIYAPSSVLHFIRTSVVMSYETSTFSISWVFAMSRVTTFSLFSRRGVNWTWTMQRHTCEVAIQAENKRWFHVIPLQKKKWNEVLYIFVALCVHRGVVGAHL